MAEEIICLGKKFNSEDERREYFRNELRKKLPELKKINGFPIGEDEDIIALSDPPYFTVCPNPWLNDFIDEWENKKYSIESRKPHFQVNEPYASDVSEGKYDPIYLYHPYPTKVPHKAIMKYILHYTQPGDIIFDGFAGTGMTAVAARFCSNSNLQTKLKINDEFKALGLTIPTWGIRNCIISDLSPLASFIASNYNTPLSLLNFIHKANEILNNIKIEFNWMFETNHTNGNRGNINYVVWSDVFLCNQCGKEIVFWETAVDKDAGKVKDSFTCPHCNSILTKREIDKAWKTEYDHILNSTVRHAKTTPVLINYSIGSKRYEKKPDAADLELVEKIDAISIDSWVPNCRMPVGDECRRNDRFGITHVHQFYTKRNLCIISRFRDLCPSEEFYILITKIAFQNTKLYRFTYQSGVWGAGGGPMSGTLYMPSLVKELNVINQIESAIKGKSKIDFPYKSGSNLIGVQSATELTDIPSESIDYIFTDPPFGANLMYSELNFISETWLKVRTNNSHEAIENNSQNKSTFDYQNLMSKCFVEYYRILKDEKWMTVEFSNTSAAIWNAIQASLQKAGFIIANVASLDKQKESFKAVTTPTAVKQDLVISCYKPSTETIKAITENPEMNIWEFVSQHLQHLPIHLIKENNTTVILERSPKILYDRLISYYLINGWPVPIDAKDFQNGLKLKFPEVDGMYFNHEQIAEYIEKKSQAPNIIQTSWQVGTESEGIEWLKRELKGNHFKYQDIQPKWMQAITAIRKGDILPELRDILQQNFIEEQDGTWRVPDMNESKDRDIIRNKALLKEFNGYAELANNPKAKRMKEVRVEALRAGFKQCWDTKDFQTIVKISDKIPQNLLLEDERLLMYFDIAKDRV